MTQTRVPAGVPTGGQFAASTRAEADVNLGTQVGPDFAATFRPEIDALEKRWRDEADVDGTFNGLIGALGQRILNASETDRPGYEKLADALEAFRESGMKDDDLAEEVIFSMQDITERDNMKVAYDAAGGQYLRLADGKPGHACGDCGSGYATERVLETHRSTDCVGPDDDGDGDDAVHDMLHSTAEAYASEINNSGRDAQVAFLLRSKVGQADIDQGIEEADGAEDALDDLVIETASTYASQAYNNGDVDTAALDASLRGEG